MWIKTKDDTATAIDRLKRRTPEALAAFIVSLAQDAGPVGEQVRTFIVGDDVESAAEALRERLQSLAVPSEYEQRHARGSEIGTNLEFILDSIETLVMPVDLGKAFELFVAFFEADSIAMENCGDHHWDVQCAFERAAAIMGVAARSVSREKAVAAVETLLASDGYGVRGVLATIIAGDLGEG